MEAGKLEKHLRDPTEEQEHCLKSVNCVQNSLGQPALMLPGSPQSFPGLGACWVPRMAGWGRWQGALGARLAGSRL